MSMGLRLWDSSGNNTLDTDDRIFKTLGSTSYSATNWSNTTAIQPDFSSVSGLTYYGFIQWNFNSNQAQTTYVSGMNPEVDFRYCCNELMNKVVVYSLDVTSNIISNTDLIGLIANVTYGKNYTPNSCARSYISSGTTQYFNNKLYTAICCATYYTNGVSTTNTFSFDLLLGRY